MSAKNPAAIQQPAPARTPTPPRKMTGLAANPLATTSRPAAPAGDLLLVCLQDPFEAVGDSSTIVRTTVPTADGNSTHQWRLEAVMEMNPPRFFQSWATRGSFTLDLSVHATTCPATGTWGGTARTTSGSGNCQVVVNRDPNNKVRFSPDAGSRHAAEVPMPAPEPRRFLNADIAFELKGAAGLSAGAVAVVSNNNWSRLTAATGAATCGLAFDNKWRQHLDAADGDAGVPGAWAFAVLTREAYEALCLSHGWVPYVLGEP